MKTGPELAEMFTSMLPFCRELGMSVEAAEPGRVSLSMPFDERFVGDATTGVVHGGPVSALLDTCGGAAVVLQPGNDAPTATIDLRIDYMRSAVPGKRIHAAAEVYHATQTVAFVRGQAWDGDPSDLVAAATGAYTFGAGPSGRTRDWTRDLASWAAGDDPRKRPPPTVATERKAAARHPTRLARLLARRVPFLDFMRIDLVGDAKDLTAVMSYDARFIGNPAIPALHGGATAGFLEAAAIVELARAQNPAISKEIPVDGTPAVRTGSRRLPKTIDFSVDFLRSGMPRDCFAKARVNRSGRRYASVHVEAWQEDRGKLFAQATGHFLNPQVNG